MEAERAEVPAEGTGEPAPAPPPRPGGLVPGRIVHFVTEDFDHRPAMVVKVWGPEGIVNLVAFAPDLLSSIRGAPGGAPGIAWPTSVRYDPTAATPRSWHFIERTA